MHVEIIKLTISYALAGVVVFTSIVTALSLVGWVSFANEKQQNRLFLVLVVEVIGIAIGSFANLLQYDTVTAQDRITETQRVETHVAAERIRANTLHEIEQILASYDSEISNQVEARLNDIFEYEAYKASNENGKIDVPSIMKLKHQRDQQAQLLHNQSDEIKLKNIARLKKVQAEYALFVSSLLPVSIKKNQQNVKELVGDKANTPNKAN